MTGDADAEEQRRLLQLSAERTGQPLEQLWLRYFAIGGSCGLVEVEAHLLGMMPLPVYECDMLAHAANERLDEMDRQARVPYSRVLRSNPTRADPGLTLVELLRDARGATPEQLGRIAADAGRSLDLNVVVYLVDHDQSALVPVPSPTSVGRQSLDVHGTLAGRVYLSGQALPLSSAGQAHLWVPLGDGVDRLGVLDVMVEDGLELSVSDRDQAADERDRVSDAHDEAASARDALADARDDRADARDEAQANPDAHAAEDRAGAEQDRKDSADDRAHSGDDRAASSADRVHSAHERAGLLLDGLTGVHRRDPGLLELEREVMQAHRTGTSFVLAFIDVDGLKALNDAEGHAAGDALLRQVVDTVRGVVREYDVIVRYGGDEFLCGLVGVDLAGVQERFKIANASLAVTRAAQVSVGLAQLIWRAACQEGATRFRRLFLATLNARVLLRAGRCQSDVRVRTTRGQTDMRGLITAGRAFRLERPLV